ncbi:MAG: hypothetical protein SF097_21195 [Acidobacteriota bacterium]|nr:hypothetical protein [Acidobacteriota bacterium]
MALQTRQNPETGAIEVLVNGEWVLFADHRRQQIDDAYQTSVRFLRDRLGEDAANQITQNSDEAESAEIG